MNYGKDFEDRFEAELKKQNVRYEREEMKRAYGQRKNNTGKFDFCGDNFAIELKSVETATRLSIPSLGRKGNTTIKSHQLKALRHDIRSHRGMLIEVRGSGAWFLPIDGYDTFVISNYVNNRKPKSITREALNDYGIMTTIEDMVKEVK